MGKKEKQRRTLWVSFRATKQEVSKLDQLANRLGVKSRSKAAQWLISQIKQFKIK